MFGKGKRSRSSNERFIIRAGIDAGNLKGRGTSDKTAPMGKGSSLDLPGKTYGEKLGVSLGKAGPVKLTRS